jgi:uncharacterized membrane protein
MEKDTARVEAFSDGVFAIAITLLILEIRVPEPDGTATAAQLTAALLRLWPSLVAFVFSFFVILVMWVSHHELMRWVRVCDYPFLFANGLLLLMVTFVPFPTAIVARYLGTEAARSAVAFYCGTFLVSSIAYGVLLLTIIHKRRLVRPEVPDAVLERVRRAYSVGPIAYGLSTALAMWDATAGLSACAALWVYWTRLSYRSSGAVR